MDERSANAISAMKRDAQIIDALHVARYALVIHNGAKVTCEGQSFKMDFERELEKIDAVMTMLGVDLSEPLPAPVNPEKGLDDDD